MCGIAGVFTVDRRVRLPVVRRMGERLQHRGPDDHGYLLYHAGQAAQPTLTRELPAEAEFSLALVHRRLSILDLSENGWQPMSSADGQAHIVYNGEVYNYRELREELEARGVTFRSTSDTEVILNAYQVWGTAAFARFTGMFALAILDRARNRLVLARDPFGIKPLYYLTHQGNLWFASETKALLEAAPGVRANNQVVFDYLISGLTDHTDDTFFEGIRQLPAATFAVVGLGGPVTSLTPVRFWQLDTRTRHRLSPEESAARFAHLFEESVRLHLRSDVPVGACLSGGIDSSSIVSTIRRIHPDSHLHTFSYIAGDQSIDESVYIDLVNAQAKARPHKVLLAGEGLTEDIERLVYAQDYPFGSTSIYAQWRIFHCIAGQNIKVVLDGQGADEMLAGYRTYLGPYFAQLMATRRLGSLLSSVRSILREQPDVKVSHLGRYLVSGYPLARRVAARAPLPGWLAPERARAYAAHSRRTRFEPTNLRDALKEHMRRDVFRSNLPSLLRYEDRNSMAFSVESRVPFLTTRLAEFIFSLDERDIIQDGTTKTILRRAMRRTVPDAILDRRDKIGFATPENAWLAGPLVKWTQDLLNGEAARSIPLLRQDVVAAQHRQMVRGQIPVHPRLWRWINLVLWTQVYGVRHA